MGYKIRLDVFEGPLDLLLYLIKKDELNIYDIPITRITEQYLEYLNMIELLDLEVAGEFLLMAATLMHIKSFMLLPPDPEGLETEELDPRAELVRRLLEYKAFKEAADRLRDFEAKRSGLFTRTDVIPEIEAGDSPFVDVTLFELMAAFSKVLKDLPQGDFHGVDKDEFTVSEKVTEIVQRLVRETVIRFSALFKAARNKNEIITTFLALLELIRQREVNIVQASLFEDIEISRNVRIVGAAEGEVNVESST